MVHAHALAEQPLQDLAERRGETRPFDGVLDGLALLLGRHAVAGEVLGAREGGVLREVHDVQGRLAVAQRELHGRLERRVDVLVGEGHGARRVGDGVDGDARALLERRGDLRRVAERGAHEEELRVGQGEQRDLPRPAAVRVAVVVKLVHRHAAHVGPFALAQRLVGEDLRRAADDGRLGVDVRVAGDHAHVVAPEHLDEVEELLAHERLDGGRVVRALAGAHRHEVHAQGHKRLARAGGRPQDDVVAHHEVHEGLLLVGPGLDAAVGHPTVEQLEDLVAGWDGVALGGLAERHAVPCAPGNRDDAPEGAERGGVGCGGCGRVLV